jgi:hypothetical protein
MADTNKSGIGEYMDRGARSQVNADDFGMAGRNNDGNAFIIRHQEGAVKKRNGKFLEKMTIDFSRKRVSFNGSLSAK